MGELRGGYIPGDLPPDDQARAERLLFEHVMGDDLPESERTAQADQSAEPDKPSD